jgi:1-phosphofructokinase family hexose kinase
MKALIVNLNLAIEKTAKIPAFRPGRIYRISGTLTQPGGKGVNVARALKELGCRPMIAGFISGHNGRWIEEKLSGETFPCLLIRHSKGESRICYSIVDSGGVSTDFNEEGPEVPAAAQARMLSELAGKAGSFQVAAVCGRLAAGIRKGFYTRLTLTLKKAGCFTAFDTSGLPLREGLQAGADMVKINDLEFEDISGCKFSRSNLLAFFNKHRLNGLKALIVTCGARSALAVSQFGMWQVRPILLKRVESSVGAGDSFMAGFISGFMRGLAFEENLRLATGCAASDCLTLGAGHISRREAEILAKTVKVRQLHH